MNSLFKSLIAFSMATAGVVAGAQDYKSWPQMEVGKQIFFVDVESTAKLGNSVVFDGFVRNEIDGLTFINPQRVLMACSGRTFTVIASAWAWDVERAIAGKLKETLDLRRSLEMTPTAVDVAPGMRTPAFRGLLQSLCKTTVKPSREAMMVISYSASKKYEAARLNTFASAGKGQVEVWMDELSETEIQGFTTDGTNWVPAVDASGKKEMHKVLSLSSNGITKSRFDCERNRLTLIAYVDYNADGTVKRSETLEKAGVPLSWQEAIPGTVGEAKLLKLCSF